METVRRCQMKLVADVCKSAGMLTSAASATWDRCVADKGAL